MQRRNARHEKDPRLFSVNKFKRKQLNFGIVVRTSHLIRLTNKPKFSTHSAMTLTRAICSRVLLFYFSLFLLFIAQQKAFYVYIFRLPCCNYGYYFIQLALSCMLRRWIRFNYIYIAEKLFKWNTLKLKTVQNDEQKSWISHNFTQNSRHSEITFSTEFMHLEEKTSFPSASIMVARLNVVNNYTTIMIPFINMHCLLKMGFLAFN